MIVIDEETGEVSVIAPACSRACSDLGPGDACPDCGHWSGVHPGVHNPALGSCALCLLLAMVL